MGIRHVDVSVANMLWDKGKEKGVLSDFDLAKPVSQITGTLPFMALDLLNEQAMKGLIAPLYRHEAESFTRVLIYLCYTVAKTGDHFSLNVNRFIKQWFSTSSVTIRGSKVDLGRFWDDPELNPHLHSKFAPLARRLYSFWKYQYHKRQAAIEDYRRAKRRLAMKGDEMVAIGEDPPFTLPTEPVAILEPYEETEEETLWWQLIAEHYTAFDRESFRDVNHLWAAYKNMQWPEVDDKDLEACCGNLIP